MLHTVKYWSWAGGDDRFVHLKLWAFPFKRFFITGTFIWIILIIQASSPDFTISFSLVFVRTDYFAFLIIFIAGCTIEMVFRPSCRFLRCDSFQFLYFWPIHTSMFLILFIAEDIFQSNIYLVSILNKCLKIATINCMSIWYCSLQLVCINSIENCSYLTYSVHCV